MLKNFICPNRAITSIEKCLEKCPFGERCAPLSYLKLCADEREWKGKPSVTQLQRGTREAWLKIKRDYSENPDSQVFRIIGSMGHALLEAYGIDPEHPLEYEGITGIPDEIERDGDEYTLIDTKVSGSYKVGLAIGITEFDTGLTGPKGKPIKKYEIVPENADMEEWAMQFNMYRVMIEHQLPITIGKIKCFMPVRDGGTFIAKNRGMDRNFYYTDVPFIDEDKVKDYFISKRDRLLFHLNNDTMPEPCNEQEAWKGNKCKGYCSVVDHCEGCPYL